MDEHPAHAQEAIPSDEPEKAERLNFREFFTVYTFMLITMLIIAAVMFDKINPSTFSFGK